MAGDPTGFRLDSSYQRHGATVIGGSPLRLFRLGYSWAGPVSLCVPYERAEMRGRDWQHAHGPVRFAVGLEAVEDLRADLERALCVLRA